jgi:hypothetical protein
MKRFLWTTLAAAAMTAFAAGAPRVPAQPGAASGATAPQAATQPGTAPARAFYSVNIVSVKREMIDEWIEFQKTQTMPMQQKGGVKSRIVWQSGAPFGEGLTYAIITPIQKFADYDLDPLATRVLGADAARAYGEKARRLVASNHTYAIQTRPELSVPPAAGFKPKAGILTSVTVVSGHADQYEAYIKNDLLPVLKRGNVSGYFVTRQVFGGDANEYVTMQVFESFAEIDKGPIAVRVLGEAAAQQLTAKAAPHVASIRRELLRFVPDLSFQPADTTSR